MWLFICVLGIQTQVLVLVWKAFLPTEPSPQPHTHSLLSPYDCITYHSSQILLMAVIHVTDHNLLSPPSLRSSFQLMTVMPAAVKVFANIFLRPNYFPECIPQSGMAFFPQCYRWNGATRATHWGSLGRPSNPQPLADSRQAEISVVLQSFKKKKQKWGKYCQMSLQEALFYSARSLRVSPEHISNLIVGACQWFYSSYQLLLVDASPGYVN